MSWLSDKINGIFVRITWNIGWLDYDASKDKSKDNRMDDEGSLDRNGKAKLEKQDGDVGNSKEGE